MKKSRQCNIANFDQTLRARGIFDGHRNEKLIRGLEIFEPKGFDQIFRGELRVF